MTSEQIQKHIEKSDFLIADITGANPNVMFELGLALGKGKKPIIIRHRDDTQPYPFDIAYMRFLPYANTWGGIEKLCGEISKILREESETTAHLQGKQNDSS